MIKERWDSYQVTTPKMNQREFTVPNDEEVIVRSRQVANLL